MGQDNLVSVLTQEQQLEIDRQIAYRLQEIEVAQAHMKEHTPKTQENSSQYNQNDRLNGCASETEKEAGEEETHPCGIPTSSVIQTTARMARGTYSCGILQPSSHWKT